MPNSFILLAVEQTAEHTEPGPHSFPSWWLPPLRSPSPENIRLCQHSAPWLGLDSQTEHVLVPMAGPPRQVTTAARLTVLISPTQPCTSEARTTSPLSFSFWQHCGPQECAFRLAGRQGDGKRSLKLLSYRHLQAHQAGTISRYTPTTSAFFLLRSSVLLKIICQLIMKILQLDFSRLRGFSTLSV